VERFDLWRDAGEPQSVHFRVVCSKGTYVRTLAADLGHALGSAAHLTALRREAIGEYSVEGAWEVTDLAQQLHQQRRQQQEGEEAAAAVAAATAERQQAEPVPEAPAAEVVAAE
jgi:tRNA pseudouridine55 synthase